MPKTLYLCYFGLREPLVQTQVLPYLREIKKDGVDVSILTFEPNPKQNWTPEQIKTEKQKLADEGIEWNFLTYHKRPSAPATLYDVLCGAWFVWKKMRREQLDVIHARIHVPAMMFALAKKFAFGKKKPKMLFDIRGFFPEEYTDAGVWKENGLLYRTVKVVEKWLFKESDGFVVLTEKAREVLFPESRESGFDKFGRPIEVIPCCIDMSRFQAFSDEARRKEFRKELGFENRFVIVHLGSLGGLYLTEQIADFYAAAKQIYPQTFALILTQSNSNLILPLLRERGFTDDDIIIKKVSPKEVSKYLEASDLALSFVKASYSTLSRSPTKIPEYLICGLPIVSNRGVGDVDELIEGDNVGIIIDNFDDNSYVKSLRAVEALREKGDLIEKCRSSAKKRFDISQVGGAGYRKIYKNLLSKNT